MSAELQCRGYDVAYFSDWTTFLNATDPKAEIETSKIADTVVEAIEGRQLQPLFISYM
ncbi:hypothetical protein [Chryseomicrobium excrementi]|uniref:hypothetical protein n=1 Tax=Chryseomicrobium excrementi TaxID=2041346 RepID=UPI0013FD27AE|nr:hypothetical protein [Chryseomicrobium excrementi]